jgi:hypothetical protein
MDLRRDSLAPLPPITPIDGRLGAAGEPEKILADLRAVISQSLSQWATEVTLFGNQKRSHATDPGNVHEVGAGNRSVHFIR